MLDYAFLLIRVHKKIAYCKAYVLFSNKTLEKGNSVKVDSLINNPVIN